MPKRGSSTAVGSLEPPLAEDVLAEPGVDGRALYLTLLATGMNTFEAIEQVRSYDPVVGAHLWMEALRLVSIPKGTFTMGSPKKEEGRWDDEGPTHEVTLSRDFQMGAVPITQGAWQALMGTNPSHFQGNLDHPVEQVSWDDICGPDGFLERLNAATEGARPGSMVFRLPTEAEWEYACRAGSKTAWSFGGDPAALAEHAWTDANSGGMTHPVGQKAPNAWGLYDTHGNVLNWCEDRFGGYPKKAVTDPAGPEQGDDRVLRGGSWGYNTRHSRSAFRLRSFPGNCSSDIGFRVACCAEWTSLA